MGGRGNGKAPPMGVPELLQAEALSLLGHATLAHTAAASKATTATFSHSNRDAFHSAGSTVSNYTEATGVNRTHPAQPGTSGQTTVFAGV